MAYIGKQPLVGNYISCDSLSPSATTTYNLTSSGTSVFPTVPQNCLVSLNGVVQAPVTSYTISGATIVFSTALSTTDTIDYVTVLGSTLNIGTPSNNTVGLSQFSATGTPSATTFLRGDNAWATPGADLVWQSVQTTSFTATAGRAYPINTTSAGITVTLPASPVAGNQVQIVDYAGTADTNAILINPNSNKLEGGTANLQLGGDREGVILTYIDATQGWIATSGINEGTDALSPPPYSVDFLVIAGGAGGGDGSAGAAGGGGGAGGYRSSNATYGSSGGGGSAESSLTFISGTTYTITVGAGGSAGSSSAGTNGADSSISGTGITTITSTGGGAGGGGSTNNGASGGSGGGGKRDSGASSKGLGTANQGFDGGNSFTNSQSSAGGGGGASAVGFNGASDGSSLSGTVSQGGAGVASTITGSSVTRAGGGGGAYDNSGGGQPLGGSGGGGSGSTASTYNGTAGTANTGGGGGGGYTGKSRAGGSGVVILRMPTASYSGTTTGSPTVSTSGADTILVYNASGTYTG